MRNQNQNMHQSSAHKGSQQTPTITRLAPCFRRKRATAGPGNITHLLAQTKQSRPSSVCCAKYRRPTCSHQRSCRPGCA
eukprot:g43381.t1